jgi:23S rRNA (guanine745-N1)-methyltransferase
MSPLACSVRNCSLPLERGERTWSCARGHSFDVARSGYVNLLQPQDRRSLTAGDSPASVEARARLLANGVGRSILDGFVSRASTLDLGSPATAIDLGCGGGDALGALAATRTIDGVGIDLSTAAVTAAARRFPSLTWAVANADRRLPILDGRASLVLSMHARRNPDECARVLAPHGFLLMAVPAAEDLVELRESVLGDRVERERGDALAADHAPLFTLVDRWTLRERHTLPRDRLLDLLRGTYRGERSSAAARLASLDRLEVTLASELFLFAPRRPTRRATLRPGAAG